MSVASVRDAAVWLVGVIVGYCVGAGIAAFLNPYVAHVTPHVLLNGLVQFAICIGLYLALRAALGRFYDLSQRGPNFVDGILIGFLVSFIPKVVR